MEGDELVLENLPEGDAPFALESSPPARPPRTRTAVGPVREPGHLLHAVRGQGFRRITYFLDRPDVMASYQVLLRETRRDYPVLLSNGNLVESGELDDGRHFARWQDPHKKPSYLFALVAGKLVAREQQSPAAPATSTCCRSGCARATWAKTEHAMNSLMASIAWDEARFGLRWIWSASRSSPPATSTWAPWKQGLNIFNTKYVLASGPRPPTPTSPISNRVGHEYFHNWTGNRVTCRDWFQLSLKRA